MRPATQYPGRFRKSWCDRCAANASHLHPLPGNRDSKKEHNRIKCCSHFVRAPGCLRDANLFLPSTGLWQVVQIVCASDTVCSYQTTPPQSNTSLDYYMAPLRWDSERNPHNRSRKRCTTDFLV